LGPLQSLLAKPAETARERVQSIVGLWLRNIHSATPFAGVSGKSTRDNAGLSIRKSVFGILIAISLAFEGLKQAVCHLQLDLMVHPDTILAAPEISMKLARCALIRQKPIR
jgi:hypothetical protein